MTDERFQSTVGSWLRDEDPAPPDSLQSARQVAARLPLVRQQSRWWPLPLLRRTSASTPATTDSTEYRPSPIPATNGHSPTAIGRTTSMLSPVKAITAGALVFAIGGAFLIAQPFGQQSDPVPAADSGDVAANWFTGSVALTSSCSTPEYEAVGTEGLIRHELGYHCEPQTWTASDPRFTGTASTTWNADVYSVDGEFFTLSAGRYDIQNETGGWICEFDIVARGYGTGAAQDSDETSTCVGTGGYEGQSAIAILDWGSRPVGMRGFIFSGDFPPLPEPPAEE